jgi:LuxR family maltose regulon positive regulatory protein
MPLHYRGAVGPVLNWLSSLPAAALDGEPSLWVTYASALTMVGRPVSAIEEKLQAAEASLQKGAPDDDLTGQIAAIRAMLAVPQNRVEAVMAQARRALAFLDPDNLPARTSASWALGHAYQLRGERAARQAFSQVLSMSQASGNLIFEIAATTGLGQLQEADNQLRLAAESYRRVLRLAGAPPPGDRQRRVPGADSYPL